MHFCFVSSILHIKFKQWDSQLEVWEQWVCAFNNLYPKRGNQEDISLQIGIQREKRDSGQEGGRWVKVMTVIIISYVFNWDNDPEEDNKTPKGKIYFPPPPYFCHFLFYFSPFNFLEVTAWNFISFDSQDGSITPNKGALLFRSLKVNVSLQFLCCVLIRNT